jgi:hypothetical protein
MHTSAAEHVIASALQLQHAYCQHSCCGNALLLIIWQLSTFAFCSVCTLCDRALLAAACTVCKLRLVSLILYSAVRAAVMLVVSAMNVGARASSKHQLQEHSSTVHCRYALQ